jgi:hypothetical protein
MEGGLMEIVDPRVDPKLVPAGSKAIVIAEHQKEYESLPSVRTPNGYVITRWQPNEQERRAILAGEDVFVTLLSAGAINPLFVTIGPTDWREGGMTYITHIDGHFCTLSCGHRYQVFGATIQVGALWPIPCTECAKERG